MDRIVALCCPINGEPLYESDLGLLTGQGVLKYTYFNGAFRVSDPKNYAENFGLEWNLFAKTLIDKYNGTRISFNRFFATTQWHGSLENQNILEVGCGAGRFTQIVLDYTKANLYAIDYSNAVDVNFKNNGPSERLHLFQANLFELPFRKGSFDKVFCFGVLQHTPDFKRSIKCLVEMLRPGGELVLDFYPINGWYTKFNMKYFLRPFTKRMDHVKLLNLISDNIDWLMWVAEFNQKIGLGFLNRLLPICDIDLSFPADPQKRREWAILDTFDMYSPVYDSPQKPQNVKRWVEELGLENVEYENVEYDKGLKVATIKGKKAYFG